MEILGSRHRNGRDDERDIFLLFGRKLSLITIPNLITPHVHLYK